MIEQVTQSSLSVAQLCAFTLYPSQMACFPAISNLTSILPERQVILDVMIWLFSISIILPTQSLLETTGSGQQHDLKGQPLPTRLDIAVSW